MNLISYLLKSKKGRSHYVDVFKKVTARLPFDLVVGDETYEVIFDFIGLDSVSANPMEKMGVYVWNKIWSKGYKNPGGYVDATLFVGEPGDIAADHIAFCDISGPKAQLNRRDRHLWHFFWNFLPQSDVIRIFGGKTQNRR
jgi:hypothetical protein